MAETVTLPVRGLRRIRVLAVLTASGIVTAALAGLLAGALLGWIADPSPVVVALVVAAAGLADLSRWHPIDVGRQVPLEWGRLFSETTTAALYGARLGVGPLTVLTSWTWWAGLVLAGLHGPFVAAGVAAVFHVVRVAVMALGVAGSQRSGPRRSALIARLDRPVAVTGSVATLLVAGAVLT
ncbi:MAG: hypothetical protein AAFZ07_03385 [Actinomycetota bacterium]